MLMFIVAPLCDDYNVFPGGCAGRYSEDYRGLIALRKE